MNSAPAACPACGTAPRQRYQLRNHQPLLQCPVCRLAWWPWPPFDPTAFYDRDYFQSETSAKGYADYASLEAGVRRTARARLKRIDRMCSAAAGKQRRLLEIGCGTGLFLDEARAAGWDCDGIEVSEYAASQASARGLRVRCGPVEEANQLATDFDCVALWDVIEHVRDPRGVIATASGALRPGGVLALSTGDITSLCAQLTRRYWHLFNLPEHLFFFSPDSLRRLISSAGCETESIVREVNWIPVSYALERLVKPLGFRPPRMGGAARWVFPATLLDVIGVYARQSRRAQP